MAWQTSVTITNATSTNLTAGAEATGAQYGTINVGAAGILNTATVSSAGFVYVASDGSATDVAVLKGGSLTLSGAYLSNTTLYGTLQVSSNGTSNARVYDVEVSSGGYLRTIPGGGGATIENVHIYSTGSAFFNNSTVVSNLIVEDGGKFALGGNSMTLVDVNDQTNIPVGAVYSGTGANKFYNWGSNFGVTNGVVTGLYIGSQMVGGKLSGGYSFTGNGFVIDGAEVGAGYNAASAMQTRSIGLYNGTIKDVVVSNYGIVMLNENNYLSNATVYAGGTLYVSNTNSITGVTTEAGAMLIMRGGAKIVGSNNHIAANTWSGGGAFYTDENGVGHDLTINGSTPHFLDMTLSGVSVISGGQLRISSGAVANHVSATGNASACASNGGTIRDLKLLYGESAGGGQAGTAFIFSTGIVDGLTAESAAYIRLSAGGSLLNANVAAGAKIIFSSAAVLGGENTTIAANTISAYTSGGTLVNMNAAYIEAGVAKSFDMRGANGRLIKFRFTDGITVDNATVRSGATLVLDTNAKMSRGTVSSGGLAEVNALGSALGVTAGDGGEIALAGGYGSGVSVTDGGTLNVLDGGQNAGAVVSTGGTLNVLDGGQNTGAAVSTGGTLNVSDGGQNTGATVSTGGTLNVSDGGRNTGATVSTGGTLIVEAGGLDTGAVISDGGKMKISSGGEGIGTIIAAGGQIYVNSAATLTSAVVQEGALSAYFSSAIINDLSIATENSVLSTVSARLTVVNGFDLRGGTGTNSARISAISGTVLNNGVVHDNGQEMILSGATAYNTYIDYKGGEQLFGGEAYGTVVGSGGSQTVHNSKGVFGTAYDTIVLSGGRIAGNRFVTGNVTYWGGFVSRAVINSGGSLSFNSNNSAFDVNVRNGGTVIVGDSCGFGGSNTRIASGAITSNTAAYTDGAGRLVNYSVIKGYQFNVLSGLTLANGTVSSGGTLICHAGATLDGVRVVSGAQLTLEAGATTKEVTLDFLSKAGNTAALVNDLSLLSDDAVVRVTGLSLGKTYTVTDNGDADAKYTVTYLGFDTEIGVGEYINPLDAGRKYTVGANGTTIKAEAHDMSSEILTTEAADLTTSGATINSGDRALKWENVSLASGGSVTFANASITGDAWLDIDSASVAAGATLYGATGNYTGTIRYLVHGAGGTLGNFAAGATSNGTVGGVELVAYKNTFAGVTYLGGQGTVTGLVSAVISSGNTLEKDFYAGALANYAKTGAVTSVGGIDTRIAMKSDGTDKVKGNIYGASQVKAGTITAATTVHSVGDVTLTVTGGTTGKGNQQCIFAGGYATGHDTAKAAAVYTVESVTATIAGGDWGTAAGGRGVFGGAMASDNIVDGTEAAGVWAQVGNVDLTISGGNMGNVYGGGWAQKNAKSEVGDVSITISGGTIANIFGGGSHSTSGGTTVAGDITITVAGGTITGDIYARGQLDGDATGTAEVIFTGGANFGCGVYGYSYVGGEAGGAALSFSSYSGTFSGKIGGFDSITLDAGTAATFDAAADVSNGAWIFDVTDRDAGLTGTALLNWTAADFAGDTITLKLGTAAPTEWTLIDAASTTAYHKFDVDGIATELILDQQIANTSTAYDGWGFTLEDTVLKFKNLA